MTPDIIKSPPSNLADYVEAKPNDLPEQHLKSLVDLLRQDTFHIKTGPIPIAWATDAINKTQPKNYRLMMQRTEVNFDEMGDAFGIFYFERQPSKPSN